MSYLVATTDENGTLTIDFGVYHSEYKVVPFQKASYTTGYMIKIHLMDDSVAVWGSDQRTFEIIPPNGNPQKGLIVESINGVVPTDLEDLFEMINNVM